MYKHMSKETGTENHTTQTVVPKASLTTVTEQC